MVKQEMTDSGLPQPFREERLAERIIDLVRAGERELLALQPDLRASTSLGGSSRTGVKTLGQASAL